MSKIKDNVSIEDRIESAIKTRKLVSQVEHIVFSFKYLSTNNRFGLKALRGKDIAAFFVEKMLELSKITMEQAWERGKVSGCEPIPFKEFADSVQEILKHTDIVQKDSLLTVFRFGENKCRIIGRSDKKQNNIFYVICFDIDFKAYGH